MSFSSINFIFYFLPIFFLFYILSPLYFKNIVLIFGSLIFYAWGKPIYLILMLFSMVFNFYMGVDISNASRKHIRKRRLIFTILVNLFILGFFKYYGFVIKNISVLTGMHINYPDLPLPIGISFYTFKNLSYIFDVYYKKTAPERKIINFAVYSTMFPHMTQGPIVRYTDVKDKLSSRTIPLARFGIGAEYFIKGLAKKVLLADNLGALYSSVTMNSSSALSAWIGILAYTFQLYFDFSGYSDMAIGLGKALGFDFPKNFDYPYISTSVSEFWRRWHMTLGSWFRDYVYFPLGGNRVSTPKHIRNILVVWTLTGLWHGASWNFVLWGGYFGVLLLIEKYFLTGFLKTAPAWVKNLYTMFAVMIGWVFFSQTSFAGIGRYLGRLFIIGAPSVADSNSIYYLKTRAVLLVISIIFCRPGMQLRFRSLIRKQPVIAILINVMLFIVSIAYMVYNTYSPFLYAQF